MKKLLQFGALISIALLGSFIFTPTALAIWDDQVSAVVITLNDVDFFDENNGWAVGDSLLGIGVILNTTDGGTTWIQQTDMGGGSPIPDVNLNAVSVIDANTAFVVGDSDGVRGIIIYTTDGGTNWTQATGAGGVVPIPNLNLRDVIAIDADTAWVVGDAEPALPAMTILNSIDVTGDDWTNQGGLEDINLFGVDAVSATEAFAVGETSAGAGTILYTDTGGVVWTGQAGAPDVNLNSVSVAEVDGDGDVTAFIVGDSDGSNGVILYTDDSGTNWTQQTGGTVPDVNLSGVAAISANVVWVVGASDGTNGVVLKTRTGGSLWTQQTQDVTNVNLGGVGAVDTSDIWSVGAAGSIFKYSDNTAPSVVLNEITSPTNDTTPTFDGSATDYDSESSVTSIEYRVDGDSFGAATITDGGGTADVDYQFTPPALDAGEHTVDVRATDAESNTTAAGSYASQTFTVTIAGDNGDGDGTNGDGTNLLATGIVKGSRFNYSLPLLFSFLISFAIYFAWSRKYLEERYRRIIWRSSEEKLNSSAKGIYLIQF